MLEKGYRPPYTITDKIVNLISVITEVLTRLSIQNELHSNPRLRRDNRVKTRKWVFRNYYLIPAIRQKLVEMTIPEKPNSSKQKYRKVRK